MPKPEAAHARMAALEGTWEGDDLMHPSPWDPDPAPARSRMVARIGLGGFHLMLDWEQRRDGTVNFSGHGVLGWDARGACYTMHWFDSSGIEHGAPALGTWEDTVLTLVHETTHMGQSRQVYDVQGDVCHFRLEHSTDGREWQPFIETEFHRTTD